MGAGLILIEVHHEVAPCNYLNLISFIVEETRLRLTRATNMR